MHLVDIASNNETKYRYADNTVCKGTTRDHCLHIVCCTVTPQTYCIPQLVMGRYFYPVTLFAAPRHIKQTSICLIRSTDDRRQLNRISSPINSPTSQ